ncbi:MAG: hypothetical protein QOK42_1934, partial [Frankiaceae bacterium]|nr:hypothetical protein [Frankiaceae bacterium]
MTTTQRAPRVAVYTRVSNDESGVGRSPKEQHAELIKVIERNGWTLAQHYTDNDKSASRYATKARPGWQAALRGIKAGSFDVLLVWEATRLTRNLEEYVELAKACRAGKVRLAYG